MSNCNINARISLAGKSSESSPNSSPEIPSKFRENRNYYTDRDREGYNERMKNGEEIETVSRESERNTILGDEDNGFTTPTSSDHKIPAVAECPPAPMKRRSQHAKLKRQAPPACRRSLQFAEVEVEPNLLPVRREGVEEIKTKKARKDDEI